MSFNSGNVLCVNVCVYRCTWGRHSMLWPLILTMVSDELDVEELTSFTTNPEMHKHIYNTHASLIILSHQTFEGH